MAREQQLLDHVERQQRGHPVIGKALPHFGEGEIGEAARVAEKGVVVVGRAASPARASNGLRLDVTLALSLAPGDWLTEVPGTAHYALLRGPPAFRSKARIELIAGQR